MKRITLVVRSKVKISIFRNVIFQLRKTQKKTKNGKRMSWDLERLELPMRRFLPPRSLPPLSLPLLRNAMPFWASLLGFMSRDDPTSSANGSGHISNDPFKY
jgi:hypothetical protein